MPGEAESHHLSGEERGEPMLALYAAIFMVSAAMLCFELTLTRLFAVTQWHHFAFISVSVALLGLGASGTWLALRPPRLSPEPKDRLVRRLAFHAALFSLSVLVAYLAINHVPFDSYRIGLEHRQLVYLVLYYSALILPFFFAALCVGTCLAAWPMWANAVYAANLLGSAVGSLAVLGLVPLLGGTGAVLAASAMGMLSATLFAHSRAASRPEKRSQRPPQGLVYAALVAPLLILSMRTPSSFDLRMSPYKPLTTALLFHDTQVLFSRWNAFSRVDVVEGAGIHSAPGLSLSLREDLPRQLALFVDGGNLSPITCLQNSNDELFLSYLPTALPFVLRPEAQALLIQPRGGLDLLVALHLGASAVSVIESNPLVLQAVRQQEDRCAASPYGDPRVSVVHEEARSYLRRSVTQFDVLVLCLTDAYQPVSSGAYGLSESYALTAEAFLEYLKHLKDDGLLVITRWMQSPPSEELRAWVLLVQALERAGASDPSRQLLAFRSWSTATLLAKRTPFRPDEIAGFMGFCAERSFDFIYYPGMSAAEANRYNVLPDNTHFESFQRVVSGVGQQGFLEEYPYEVSPSSDDRPFFFHYFKWAQVPAILRNLGKTWQPFGGSGFLILIVLLAVAAILSVVLILLPLAVPSSADSRRLDLDLRRTLLYFAFLGLGFLFVEMPLLQQFILFLGQPAYSFALVLFSVLFFSGLGSLVSARLPLRPVLLVLTGTVLAYPLFLTRLFAVSLHWSLPLRLAACVLSLAPLGFLLGLPMPAGIRLLEKSTPQLIPWAWAVNGCASVVSSILAVMVAVSWGFSRVLVGGALSYFLAWLMITLPVSWTSRVAEARVGSPEP